MAAYLSFSPRGNPSPNRTSVALTKEKGTRSCPSPAETIFVASITSSFHASAYHKFNFVEFLPAFRLRRESSNRRSIALLGDSFLNRGGSSSLLSFLSCARIAGSGANPVTNAPRNDHQYW